MNQGSVDTSAITTLTFDVVGTVIDFETGILEWWRPHLEGQGIRIEDAGILAAFAEAEDRLQRQRPDLPFTDMLPLIYRGLAETWALNGDEEAAGDFQSSIAHWPAFPDSEEALRTLGQHFRLVAMTNADAWATRAMNRTVGNVFDDQVTCDEVGVNKPDQRCGTTGTLIKNRCRYLYKNCLFRCLKWIHWFHSIKAPRLNTGFGHLAVHQA